MTPDFFLQHARLKSRQPDALLLMCIGNFYEAFDEDADIVARVLSPAKTTCAEHRVAGFPSMQLDRFLTALVEAGFRVAIAEQVGNSSPPGSPCVVRKEVL